MLHNTVQHIQMTIKRQTYRVLIAVPHILNEMREAGVGAGHLCEDRLLWQVIVPNSDASRRTFQDTPDILSEIRKGAD